MAKWTAVKCNWTPTAVADTTNFTDGGYMALQGGSSTQLNKINEVLVEGGASASAASQLVVALDSTVGATSLTGVSVTPNSALTAALTNPPLGFSASTTKPQRSSNYLLPVTFNAFGGVFRWHAAPEEEFWIYGNATNKGEASLSHLSSGTAGLISASIGFEPY